MNNLMKKLVMVFVLLMVIPGVLALGISPATPDTTDGLTCTGGEQGFTYKWFHSSVADPNYLDSGISLLPTQTSKGLTIFCQTYFDLPLGGGSVPGVSTSIVIGNAPPLAPVVSFIGESYFANSAINVFANATDPDSDPKTYYYTFRNQTAVLQTGTSNTYACSWQNCTKHTNISVEVATFDGTDYSLTNTTNLSLILNSAPVISSFVPVNPNLYIYELLNASLTVTDADNDSLAAIFQFYNFNSSTIVQAFSGVNAYSLALSDAHDTIGVTVNVSDLDAVPTQSFFNLTVLNSDPIWNLSSVSFNQGQTLFLNLSLNGSDSDGDALSFSRVDPANVTSTLNGDNLTISSIGNFAGTQNINLTVTDAYGGSLNYSLPVTVIDTGDPFVNITSPVDGFEYNTTSRNATINYTINDNGVLDTCWYVSNFNGTNNVACGGNSLNFYNLADGNYNFTLFANDTLNNEANDTLSFSVSLNDAPIWNLSNISFDQNTSYFLNMSLNSSDQDGDPLTYSSVSAANITATVNGDNLTITHDTLFLGAQTVNLTVSDGTLSATQVVLVTILDAENPFVNITSPALWTNYTSTKNVTVNYTITDNGNLSACWYSLNGGASQSLNCSGNSFNFTNMADQNHSVVVYANDSRNNLGSDIVNFTVDFNTVPSVSSVILNSGARTADDLICNFTLTDLEQTASDALTANYTWFKDNVADLSGTITATNGTAKWITLDSGNTSKGENWTCQITSFDNKEYGSVLNSSGSVILNTVPVLNTSISDPSQPWLQNTNKSIDLTDAFSDVDGDDLNYTASVAQNITAYIDNSTNMVILEPDVGFSGVRTINFTAWDDEDGNITSLNVNLNVGVSTIIDSFIAGTNYSGTFYLSNVTGVTVSTINISNVTGSPLTVYNSTVFNSTIIDSELFNCIVLDSRLEGMFCSDAFIDPSDVKYSNITGSNITDSHVWYSNVTYSNVSLSSIDNSTVTGANVNDSNVSLSIVTGDSNLENAIVILSNLTDTNVTDSTLTNVTAIGSTIFNSTIANNTLNFANVSNGVLYNGTMLLQNGSVYNASDVGQQNLTSLVNSPPIANIFAPLDLSSHDNGVTIVFNATGSTDVNIGGLLADNITYNWDFGNGVSVNTTNVTHSYTYTVDGPYNVTLTVTDNYNETDTDMIGITVSTPVVPPIIPGGSPGGSTNDNGEEVTLSKGQTKRLSQNGYIRFKFLNEFHKVTLERIYSDFVKVKVESTPQTGILKVNDVGKFDLNDDGTYDLKLTLTKLTSSIATFRFESTSEKIVVDEPEPEAEAGNETAEEEPEIEEEKEEGKISKWWNTITGKASSSWNSAKEFSIHEKFKNFWTWLKEKFSKDEVEAGNETAEEEPEIEEEKEEGKISKWWKNLTTKVKDFTSKVKDFLSNNKKNLIPAAIGVVVLGFLGWVLFKLKKGNQPVKSKVRPLVGGEKEVPVEKKKKWKNPIKVVGNAIRNSLVKVLEKLLNKLKK
ncbi:beta strand repeat-containing protein [Nanoarchaeota archaeon]